MIDDLTLWKGLQQGDKDMFLALYKRYYHPLLFLGLKEVKDGPLVKDTIQQLFLYLWEKRASIAIANNPKSYLFSSFLRKLTADWKKAGKSAHLRVEWNQAYPDAPTTPEEKLITKDETSQRYKLLMAHINELPNRQKELIVLKFYEGLSYEEIVQRTGLSSRTVYNKIHEAVKKLKLDMLAGNNANIAALVWVATTLIAGAISRFL